MRKLGDFEEYYIPEPNSGCWIWLAGTSGGYGSYHGDYAHVYSYWRGKKRKKYDGGKLEVHHKCENRLCVNPKHLELALQGSHRHIHFKDRLTCKRGHSSSYRTYRENGKYYCKECARTHHRKET